MKKEDLPVFTLVGGAIRIVESGIYTNAGSQATTWNLPPLDGTANVEDSLYFYCVNRGTVNVNITSIIGTQFFVNGVGQVGFALRPGKSAYIVSDGWYYYALFAEEPSTVQRFTPTAASNTTILQHFAPIINVILVPSATIATATVTFPTTPFDGQSIKLVTKQEITSLTLAGGTFSGAVTTLAANAFVTYVYVAADTTWYRIG